MAGGIERFSDGDDSEDTQRPLSATSARLHAIIGGSERQISSAEHARAAKLCRLTGVPTRYAEGVALIISRVRAPDGRAHDARSGHLDLELLAREDRMRRNMPRRPGEAA